MQLETIYAVEGLSVKASNNGLFFVFANGNQVEKFSSYNEAHGLLQELFIARETTKDQMIGQVRFCTDDFGSGMLVAVVGKDKGGYLVQPVGGRTRFTISANELQDPPAVVETGQEFYVKPSEVFDAQPYDAGRIAQALTKAGAHTVHAERQFGWVNQPEVVVFAGLDEQKAASAIGKALNAEQIVIKKKSW